MHRTVQAPDARGRVSRLRPSRGDIALAGAFLAMTVAETVFNPDVDSVARHLVLAGPAMVALAWRRSFPVLVALIAVGSNIAVNPDGQFSTLLALVLVAYTVGAETGPPRNYLGLAVVLVPFVTAMAVMGLEPSDVGAAIVFLVGPWAVGTAVRQRVAHTADAVARAERMEREQGMQAAAAALQERTRIARELHDIVSHSISVITIQTQAVRRRLGPENAREAADLAAVEATAREALSEMRRLFGVLRKDGEAASLTPQPGLDELGRLLDQFRSAGLDVQLVVEGARHPLTPGIDLAAYRIVQEALTNTLRHSEAGRATVVLGYRPQLLEVTVEDDGRGIGLEAPGGHGLVGVRERVALYAGTVEVGTGEHGGVRLAASLPLGDDR